MKKKNIIIDNEEVTVPDIKIGDEIEITMSDRDDPDLLDWLLDHKGEKFIVSDLDYDTGIVWIEECPFGIDMIFISDIF